MSIKREDFTTTQNSEGLETNSNRAAAITVLRSDILGRSYPHIHLTRHLHKGNPLLGSEVQPPVPYLHLPDLQKKTSVPYATENCRQAPFPIPKD